MKTNFNKKENFSSKKSFGKKKKDEIEINYTSENPEIEQDSKDEILAIHKEFGKNKQKEIKSFEEQTATDFYFCVYFKTGEQKRKFLELAKLLDLVDKSERLISGEQMADKLNIPLEKVQIKSKGFFKQGKRFSLLDYI